MNNDFASGLLLFHYNVIINEITRFSFYNFYGCSSKVFALKHEIINVFLLLIIFGLMNYCNNTNTKV